MRIGIFADVHGNGWAFERVYHALEKEKCDAWFFCGDICGYYYDQGAIIDRLRQTRSLYAVLGNHDSLFLQLLDGSLADKDYSSRYGRSLEFLKESITADQIAFLRGLPSNLEVFELGVAVFHGSPWSFLDEYVYPDSDFTGFDRLPYRLVLLGHTHYPMDIRRKGIRIINPGSAGQPRDGGWPSYAVYETQTEKLEIRRVTYDVRPLIQDIKRRREQNPYLIDVLHRMKEPT